MGTLCLRPDWVHSARFSLGCGRMHVQGVLALVVVAPCGFAAHVAPEEAVLSSPRNRCERRKLRNLLHPWGPCPYHLPPQNQSPWTPPPEPLHPSHPTGYPSKNIIFLLFSRQKKDTQVAKFAPSLGPVPPPPTPPGTKAPGPPLSRAHPTGYPSKKSFFFCPYHLPPRHRSPWTPLPSPCTPPHPTGYPSFFLFLYALKTSKIRRKLRNLLRFWGPCPYHLPPRHRSPWTPPEPQPRA